MKKLIVHITGITMLFILSIGKARAQPPAFDEILKWQLQLPSKTLQNIDLDGSSIINAWNDLNRKYFVRSILVSGSETITIDSHAPRITMQNVTVTDVYGMLCDHFGFNWTQDKSTGIVWIYPSSFSYPDSLNIPMPDVRCGIELGLMEDVLIPAYRNGAINIPQFLFGTLWASTFNRQVEIQPGSCSLYQILNDVCMSSLPLTFHIGTRSPVYTVTPVNLAADSHVATRTGEQLFASQNFGLTHPDDLLLMDELSSNDESRQAAAYQYIESRGWNVPYDTWLGRAKNKTQQVYTAVAFSRLLHRDTNSTIPVSIRSVLNEATTDPDFAREHPDAHVSAALELMRQGSSKGIEGLTVDDESIVNSVRHRRDAILAVKGVSDLREQLHAKGKEQKRESALVNKLKNSANESDLNLYSTLTKASDHLTSCTCE